MAKATEVPIRLVRVDELDDRQVTAVDTPHGTLAVGISRGKPFAVSNRCRHLLAPLSRGHVADDGCLECPRHAARFNVHTGRMTIGPQGVFRPLGSVVKSTTGARPLKTFPVTLRDGAIWLDA